MKRILSMMLLSLMMIPCMTGLVSIHGHEVMPVVVAEASGTTGGSDKVIEATTNGDSITISGANFPSMTGNSNIVDLAKGPLDKYKSIATIVTGFATVTAFLAMIFCFTKLSMAGDNEQERKKAIAGILTSGIGVALLGSATLIIGFFWKLFKA